MATDSKSNTTPSDAEYARSLKEAYDNATPSWEAFISAAKAYANHLDQWEKVKWQTPYGMVYLTIGRADPYPDSFEEISGD